MTQLRTIESRPRVRDTNHRSRSQARHQPPQWTYRPDLLEPLGIGLIRIDVALTGPGLRPIAESTRCPPAGDHCAVIATVGVD
ncbi:MAG: hypothetical protein ACXW0S_04845 [Solirubrobacterales bacterium]